MGAKSKRVGSKEAGGGGVVKGGLEKRSVPAGDAEGTRNT